MTFLHAHFSFFVALFGITVGAGIGLLATIHFHF